MPEQGIYGDVVNRLLPRRHQMVELAEDVTYIDNAGMPWSVPHGFRYDGSSIPAVAWWIYGSPFVGPHRRGAPFHDFECMRQVYPCKMVHEMYRELIIWDGTPKWKADQMHWFIMRGGPKW